MTQRFILLLLLLLPGTVSSVRPLWWAENALRIQHWTVMLQMQSTCYWQPALYQPSKRVTLFYTLTQRQTALPSLASVFSQKIRFAFSLHPAAPYKCLHLSSSSLPLCLFLSLLPLIVNPFTCDVTFSTPVHDRLQRECTHSHTHTQIYFSLLCVHGIVYIITRIHELWDKLKGTVDTFTCNQMKRKNTRQMIWERKIVFDSV